MIAATCLVITPRSAGAEQPQSTLIPGNAARPDYGTGADDLTLKIARRIAACVVKARPKQAQLFIEAQGKDVERARRALGPDLIDCMGSQAARMTFSNHSAQSFFAEAWLQRQGMPALPALPPTPGRYQAAWVSEEPAQRALDELAICLASTQPELVRAIIMSGPLSDEEGKAFGSLAPQLKSCIAADAGVRTTRAGLRLALATAAYHRVYEAAVPATAIPAKQN